MYKSLKEIVDQLELCNFVDAYGHELKMNTAFIALKKEASLLNEINPICKVKRSFAFYMLANKALWIEGVICNKQLGIFLNKHIEKPFKSFEVIYDDDLSYSENDKFAKDFLANQI